MEIKALHVKNKKARTLFFPYIKFFFIVLSTLLEIKVVYLTTDNKPITFKFVKNYDKLDMLEFARCYCYDQELFNNSLLLHWF